MEAEQKAEKARMHILGGGPAGLAFAWYARQAGHSFRLFEAASELGGNARTLRCGSFGIDTGAHRLHDRDAASSALFRALLGDDLLTVDAPSQIVHEGRLIDFPLSPLNIARNLPFSTFLRIARENLGRHPNKDRVPTNFYERAVDTYGAKLASMFLLNYSEKLWGLPCDKLALRIAGKRLQGLTISTLIKEAFLGKRAKTSHLDGSFYYPRYGIGQLFQRIEEKLDGASIRKTARITALHAVGNRIADIEINGRETIAVDELVSSLPLTLMLKILRPAPPDELLAIANSLRFRHLRLAVFMLKREQFSPNASLYFPSAEVPFTRIYEPRNRSAALAPSGQTAIAVELPCFRDDQIWRADAAKLRSIVEEHLLRNSLLEADEIIDFAAFAIPFAYPVLATDFDAKSARLLEYLQRFRNLHILGRSALFEYTHIHDLFRQARELLGELSLPEADVLQHRP